MKPSRVKSGNVEVIMEYAAFGRKSDGDWVRIDILRPNAKLACNDIKDYLALREEIPDWEDYDEYGVRKRMTVITHTDWENDWEDTKD